MLNSSELLAVAELLADASAPKAPSDAQLRRAISTASYALFHAIVAAAALRFIGASAVGRPGYALLYRGFEHGRMKRMCEDIDKPTLRANMQRQLRLTTVNDHLRNFATAFVALQQRRHQADYDPHIAFTHAEAIEAVGIAAQAIIAIENAPADERTDLFALLLASVRDT